MFDDGTGIEDEGMILCSLLSSMIMVVDVDGGGVGVVRQAAIGNVDAIGGSAGGVVGRSGWAHGHGC